jgi:oxygen-independent coproporphyrinogen-3 oxidase
LEELPPTNLLIIHHTHILPSQGLYIHIPFCESICPYCDFSTWKASERQHQRWLRTVLRELHHRCTPGTAFQTLYLGGGTPSLLSEESINTLFEELHSFLDLRNLQEISIEANPVKLNHTLLQTYAKWNISRVSLGVQSFDDPTLKALGRNHNSQEALDSVQLLAKYPFSLNVDLMFGTPNQNMEILKKDLDTIASLPIQHVSLYGLTIEPNTLFHQQYQKAKLPPMPEDVYDEMYLYSVHFLEELGFKRYEVSNFAKTDHQSIHNSHYWNHSDYLGIGPGAHSLQNGFRIANSKKYATYEKWVEKGCEIQHTFFEKLDNEALYTESIWLGLRQTQGISLTELQEAFSKTPSIKNMDKWEKLGYLYVNEDNRLELKNKGWLYLDTIAANLSS